MARLSATAALVVLLSLLAVAHCRTLEESATNVESSTDVAAAGDENGPPNPMVPAEENLAEVVLPAEQQQPGFLRLPSHRLRRHRPCSHGLSHRHIWWTRHHGAFGDDAPRRFHHPHFDVPSHLTVVPVVHEISDAGESRPVAVAEPDPDRSLSNGDGEGEVASREPSFVDADGAHEEAAAHEDEGAAVRVWKKEMQRRWWFHHHHGMHLHRHHRDEAEEGHEQEGEAAEGLKRFHHHHEDEEKDVTRKRLRHAAEHDDSDSDEEEDEVEEMVRRFRKAIMRRRFGHGRRFHHRHHHGYGHRHAEEAEKADAQEEGSVVSWIKGFMNRF